MTRTITPHFEQYCAMMMDNGLKIMRGALRSWPFILAEKGWAQSGAEYRMLREASCSSYVLRRFDAWRTVAEGLKTCGIQNAPFLPAPFMDIFVHQAAALASISDWEGAVAVIDRALAGTRKRKWTPDDVAKAALLAFLGRNEGAEREVNVLQKRLDERDMKRAEAGHVAVMLRVIRSYLCGNWAAMANDGQELDRYWENTRRLFAKQSSDDGLDTAHFIDFPFVLLLFGARSRGACDMPRFDCADVEWMAKGID